VSAALKHRDDMDARIRARRARVRSEAVRRRQRRTLSLFVLLLLVACVAVALRSPLFEISAIEVRGVSSARAEAVRQAATISKGEHLLTAPLERAQASVEGLAWVKSAVVHRLPPSTVAIDVTPRRPLLTVETSTAAWKVDEDAVVIAGGRVSDAPAISVGDLKIPALGSAIEDRTVRDAVTVHRRLPEQLRRQVAVYRVEGPRDLWLRMQVRTGKGESADTATVDVRIGTAKDLALKAEVLRVLLPQAVEEQRDLDIRAPANPVVVDSRATASGSG
jgi:cell division septal protein FtsQ